MAGFSSKVSKTAGSIELVGDIDLAAVEGLAADFLRDPVSVVDLSGVTFMDSTGLHVLVEAARRRNGQGPLRLRNPSPHVIRMMEIVGVDEMPEIDVRSD